MRTRESQQMLEAGSLRKDDRVSPLQKLPEKLVRMCASARIVSSGRRS